METNVKETNRRRSLKILLITIVAIVAVNFISNFAFTRIDLTSDRHFSLTDFTRDYLSNLQGSVMVRVYLDGDELPVSFGRMRDEIRSKLEEFKIYGGSNLPTLLSIPRRMTIRMRVTEFTSNFLTSDSAPSRLTTTPRNRPQRQ